MSKCIKCGLPQFDGAAGYVGPQCKCWAIYGPFPPQQGCAPVKSLTEEDVRRIVQEELARRTPAVG